MNLLAVFIVLFPAAVYSSISSKPYLKPRIAEGIPVNIKHFHNQALIKLGPGGRGTCGGIIYDSTTIITAAHCIESESDGYNFFPEDISVYVGAPEKGLSEYKVVSTVVHEDYDDDTLSHDIAILKLSSKIAYNRNAQPKEFVPENFVLPGGNECLVSGYGKMNITHFSDTLRATPIILWDEDVCDDYFTNSPVTNYYNKQTMACGKGYPGGGTCPGDSGGPLVCLHQGRWLLYGIISYGNQGLCDIVHKVSGFTRLSPFYNWIRQASTKQR